MSAPLKILTGTVAENYQGFNYVVQDPNDPETIDGTEYGIPLAGFKYEADAVAFVAAKSPQQKGGSDND